VQKDWFGGRVLIPFDSYMNNRKFYFDPHYLIRPANIEEPEEIY